MKVPFYAVWVSVPAKVGVYAASTVDSDMLNVITEELSEPTICPNQ